VLRPVQPARRRALAVSGAARRQIGRSLRRREDVRLLVGAARYTDDLNEPGQLWLAFSRSPHAHARLRGIDAAAAHAVPGVAAVLTGEDAAADGLRPFSAYTRRPPFALRNRDGSEMPDPPYWPLARDKVRHVGEPVALVAAESAAAAREAAERIEVDYEPLPAAIETDPALAPDAPRVWEELPDNLSFDYETGDTAAVEAAFARADRRVHLEVDQPRVVVAFLEPRSVLARYDGASGRYTVHAGGQSPHWIRDVLAEVLDVAPERIRAITPETGGGFGARTRPQAEVALAAWVARRLDRPVKWTAERSESFVSDTQGRDQRTRVELALDGDGRFLALSFDVLWRHGAYLPARVLWVLVKHMAEVICGPYRIPACRFRIRGVFTNTLPIAAFRGIGRAEAAYALERLVDAAARASGRDPVALRRLNAVPPDAMPWTTPAGAMYDGGDYPRLLDAALAAAGHDGFAARRAEALRAGRLRGLGVSLYVESEGGAPAEFAEVRVDAQRTITAFVGTRSFGMGHETTYAQILADALGVDPEQVRLVDDDTDRVASGSGSHGSRSMRIGGSATVAAAERVIERGRLLAAELLEAAAEDIVFEHGEFVIAGTDACIDLFEVAAAADTRGETLAAQATFTTAAPTYSSGCHVCEVEIDPETGQVTLAGYAMSADPGTIVNPLVVDGQLHGGIAQGVGQALLERAVYDPEDGQLVSGSFLDYALPRAGDLPFFTTRLEATPAPDNPLGVRGAGEGGTTGAPAAVMNAILDALAPCGVTALDMPATPERVWRALARARPRSS